nr:hypothetical protein [Tanacetum cinerariifolium]
MADQRTMAELLRAPTEGYAEAIVVLAILADQFELKHSLINMMTTDQFFELEKDNPHDHIRWFNKITSTIKYKDVPNSQTSAVTTAMTAILKQFQAIPPPASVKAVEEICVTCGGTHPYYQCLAAGGNTFPELRDNIQGYVSAAAINYNQCNSVYRPPEKVKRMNEANMKAMQTQINMVKNELRNEMKNAIQASLSNQTHEIKNMMASLLQMNSASTSGWGSLPSNTVANPKGELKAITTRSGLVVDGPTVLIPPTITNPKEDERVEETLTDPDLIEYTIKVPPPPVQKCKPSSQRDYIVHQRDPLHPNILYPSRMLKQKQQENDEVQIQNFWQMFKQLHINITLADALILMPKPFLRTARALIDVHGEEMILHDGDERLTLNMRHDTSSYYNQPQKESINFIDVFNDSSEDFLEDLFSNQPSGNPTFSSHSELTLPEVQNDIFDSEGGNVLPEKLLDHDSTKDLHPLLHVNPLSGSTTYSSFPNPLLEELADELALITSPLKYDDDL